MGDSRPHDALPRNEWPFVGRATALGAVTEAAARQDVNGVVIVGLPGLGRTRLAREAADRLGAAGHPTDWSTGTRAAGTIALGALLHLAPLSDSAVPATRQVFGRIVERFSAPTGRRPVLVVDDAHLLDSASAALVHRLAVHARTFVLLTARQGQVTPDVVTAPWKERLARRVELRPLSDADMDALLERGLGGPLDAVTRRALRRLSAGNPLVLRELAQSGLEGEALVRVDGIWHLREELRITGRLGDLIEAQMQVRDPGVLSVLEVLACGEPLGQHVVEDIAGHAAVVQAERQGLIVAELSGSRHQVRLAIPAYGEVIRARMPRARAWAIWGRLADSLGQVAAPAGGRRARTGPGPAQGGARLAGPRAAGRRRVRRRPAGAGGRRAAVGRLPRGRRRGGRGPDPGRGAGAAGPLRGRGRRPPGCGGVRRRGARRPAGHPPDEDRYWKHQVSPLRGDPGGDRAAEAVRAWTMLLEGHVARSLAAGTALLATACPPLPVEATLRAATAVTLAAGLTGDIGRADAASVTGLRAAAANRTASPWERTQLGAARCLAHLLAGALTTAAEAAEAGYREAVEAQTAPVVGVWTVLRGFVAKAQGRAKPAQLALREAIVLLGDQDPLRLRGLYLAELAGAYAMAGDTVRADACLGRMAGCPPPPGVIFDAWIERDRAWVAAATLDLLGAANHAMDAAKAAREAGTPMVEALALFDAARFGAAKEVCERLHRIAGETAAPATAAFARAATALAGDDARSLMAAAGTLDRTGHLLHAAEAAATAHGLHAAAGRRTAAKAALAFARELLAECGGARTPLTDLTGSGASLTPRELQVAKLIAAGLSARAVANRLDLSLRTVNNHLGRAYAKLGVSGRDALAQVLSGPTGRPEDSGPAGR